MGKVKLAVSKEPIINKNVLLTSMMDLMEKNENVVQLDADLAGAAGLYPLYEKYPGRTKNCGVMEANMLGVACGMSVMGKIPFAHTFAAFITRRDLDQVFMSGAYNKANVKMIGTDPGIMAEKNGGTHMPFEDIGIMRTIPDMTVIDCADAVMLRKLIPMIAEIYGMVYLRLSRGANTPVYADETEFEIGKGLVLAEGEDVTIIACGIEVPYALEAAEKLKEKNISARVVDMFTIKPVDRELVIECAEKTTAIVTCENGNYINGLGSAVAEILSENGIGLLERVGVKDMFGEVGAKDYLAHRFEIDCDAIVAAAERVVRRK